ncbi:DUF692 family multinuclear iron-containing protein [Acinetobacter pittii]|uniref:multinuclear nonheme iron-dependent oxidase n=1 Tax=Acinetobacter pittii TaxID=48296 RepID=UPI0021CDAAB9|nr:DUF692 family multinuclear iron-containing protein [Acinetobacter pittii]MCU4401397.1 DUF692 family protein [Acinetobacter pittii]MCU4404501.1 DUF692 family protein [Acinetobacter pittii]
MSYIIGAGYNRLFDIAESGLKIPEDVSFIELGIDELNNTDQKSSSLIGKKISLHLARTPMVEDEIAQDNYIDFLEKIINDAKFKKLELISIGIHLSGSRFTGGGLLGDVDVYSPTKENLDKVVSFIKKIQKLNLEVWIENASFYSEKISDVIETWQHVNYLCSEFKCKCIIDISHIVIEGNNIDIEPNLILGMVPWKSVIELHLSGIKQGKDGCMHDGHGLPVHDDVWKFLRLAIRILDGINENIYITIEHTPPSWKDKVDIYNNDFIKLNNILRDKYNFISYFNNIESYMYGYLKYIIDIKVPLLKEAFLQRGIDYDETLYSWVDIVKKNKQRIVIHMSEIPLSERNRAVDLVSGFMMYAKKEIENIDKKRMIKK